ncbi:hypothetical protein FALBO_13376 [Fusarium albosuccineum]|uniref:AA1-like domain-containing protein n=2 Tax=Fusarium decemcellulare species complex TaxID=1329916 RepID=A0A8H4KYP5_9HYPO|nr:hypothetical protein FALBO_13376 [Fusarium albosuccineum]KAF5007073.1 hypothetical protein FDECE_6577 [Fusarium decemcellulare]KAJ3527368.1 hypothetical protein NM208_g10735 [Fusarium decemcellulare]
MQFLTTLLLATSAMALPTVTLTSRADSQSCMAKGAKVTEWTVHDFEFEATYTKSSPKKQTSTGTVSFTIENPVLNYKAKCHATSKKGDVFFTGSTDYDCDVPLKGDAASFTYDRKSGKVGIVQSWSCLKEGGRFEAKGNTKVKLDCKEANWKNPNYKDGAKVYSNRRVTCTKKSFKTPILEMSAVL